MTNRELISVACKNILEIGKIADSAMEGLLAENESLQNQLIQRNDELLKLREQVPRWISVSERLPENDERVLALCRDGVIHDMRWNYPSWEWRDRLSGDAYFEEFVTHWMPLPSTEGVE